jgi:hypothetical protein
MLTSVGLLINVARHGQVRRSHRASPLLNAESAAASIL